MDRKTLKIPFELKNPPDWTCPTCQAAPLRIQKDTFKHAEGFKSRDHSPIEWEPEWTEYTYSCMLECSNGKCKEAVSSGGTGTIDWDEDTDHEGDSFQRFFDKFQPKFFIPHLKLFKIPPNTPESVSKPLEVSFSLFFSSAHAALNNVRIAVEALLTELNVRRFDSIGGKRRFISLHGRIALLPAKYSELKELMLAIKWLGNAGSHDGDAEVSIDDAMDSYEMMEHILEEIYLRKTGALKKLAKKVNKKKGPVK